MKRAERMKLLEELVNEVTRENLDQDRVQQLMNQLSIPYSTDPMELLNNVLKGIHSEGPNHEVPHK